MFCHVGCFNVMYGSSAQFNAQMCGIGTTLLGRGPDTHAATWFDRGNVLVVLTTSFPFIG